MENNVFVNKLIKGTKEGTVIWQPVTSNKSSYSYQPYYLQKGDKKLVLEKYNTMEYDGLGGEFSNINCALSICDDDFNPLGEIHEDDLQKGNDLIRLYRLAERKVNNVDDIMEEFVKGINDIEF